MILSIRTDKPEAEIGLFKSENSENSEGSKAEITELSYKKWEAQRQLAETLHQEIKALLDSQNADWDQITGILVFQGPGSFTGLRIGISLANALAYGLGVPVVGSKGSDWLGTGVQQLIQISHGAQHKQQTNKQTSVIPEYGSPPHITTPKK